VAHRYPLSDRQLRWRSALGDPRPDRILFHNLWFRGHNNPRHAELLPRLARLDPYLLVCSDRRIPRGIQYRLIDRTQRPRDAVVLRVLGRRYRYQLAVDHRQIPHFPGRIVVDADDPFFTPAEVSHLGLSNVAAYVVTAERAARRYEALGVAKPWHVVPQGVDLSALREDAVAEVAAVRPKGGLVVGYTAAFLVTAGDRDAANTLYNVDHLLELWDAIRERISSATLWLLGQPSDRLRARLASREDVWLFGRVPRERVLAHVANFDIALYPRTRDQGIRAAKVGEYLGAGVPTVSYDYEVTENIRQAGAGILVGTPREFVDAVVTLADDEPVRKQLAEAARRAGAQLDWRLLARRFEEEILDRYLPPGANR
jgi:glycosyltransferase involved in cell wall biosynthesis